MTTKPRFRLLSPDGLEVRVGRRDWIVVDQADSKWLTPEARMWLWSLKLEVLKFTNHGTFGEDEIVSLPLEVDE